MKCPLCGQEAEQDDLFCGNCGYNLLQDREQAPEESPAEAAPVPDAPVIGAPSSTPLEPSLPARTAVLPAGAAGPGAKKPVSTWLIVLLVALLVFLCCCCVAGLLWFVNQPSYY
ncbi:MAG: hypothetical protein GXY76_12780 [Chloroflexi bacterium]|nr:hypothetical protein [Chloroflexota bacterium]